MAGAGDLNSLFPHRGLSPDRIGSSAVARVRAAIVARRETTAPDPLRCNVAKPVSATSSPRSSA
jgi:hypothetical protein